MQQDTKAETTKAPKKAGRYESSKARGLVAIHWLLPRDERDAIKAAAAASGSSIPDFLRARAFGIQRKTPAIDPSPKDALPNPTETKATLPPAIPKEILGALDDLGKISRQCHDMMAATRRMEETLGFIRMGMAAWQDVHRDAVIALVQHAIASHTDATRDFFSCTDILATVGRSIQDASLAIRGMPARADTARPIVVAAPKGMEAGQAQRNEHPKAQQPSPIEWTVISIPLNGDKGRADVSTWLKRNGIDAHPEPNGIRVPKLAAGRASAMLADWLDTVEKRNNEGQRMATETKAGQAAAATQREEDEKNARTIWIDNPSGEAAAEALFSDMAAKGQKLPRTWRHVGGRVGCMPLGAKDIPEYIRVLEAAKAMNSECVICKDRMTAQRAAVVLKEKGIPVLCVYDGQDTHGPLVYGQDLEAAKQAVRDYLK